jgi:hypothetical protein
MLKILSGPTGRRRLVIALGVVLGIAVVAIAVALVMIGRSEAGKKTAERETTSTVEATASLEPTASAEPSAPPPAATGPAVPAGFAAVSPPKQFATFVKQFATTSKDPATGAPGRAWFPSSLPEGFKLDSADQSELEPGAGPFMDVLFAKGDAEIGLMQGGPKGRDYEIVAIETVAWGSEKASVMREDPEDAASPIYIVYSDGRNLAELNGDVPLATLKQIAAGMVVIP